MLDSLRYGIPSGLFAFGVFWVHASTMDGENSIIRWLLIGLIILVTTLLSIRAKNPAHFPFSYAFLSGFNVLFIATIVQGLLILGLGGDTFFSLPDEVSSMEWSFYWVFQESFGLMSVSIIELLGLSYFLKKKK